MWLVTAVGPVLGQKHFTFVLEHSRRYTVGRAESNDICFSAMNVRPLDGALEVGAWDPANPSISPTLKWKVEPRKSKVVPPLKVLTQMDGPTGSRNRLDYSVEEIQEPELEFGEPGKGVEIAADVWFSTHWQPLHICYDEAKETEYGDLLDKNCVRRSSSLDPNVLPDVLVSPALTPNNDCTYAVCYGVPIVTPAWLQMFAAKLRACWKKAADSQDSYSMPDTSNVAYEPPLDPDAAKKQRGDRRAWRTDRENRFLFSGYRVVGISKTVVPERKWFQAMGADWDDLDVLSQPLQSSSDFLERLKPSLDAASASGRDVLIAYLPSARKAIEAQNVNFDNTVLGTCASQGILIYGAAKVLWGAVMYAGVTNFFDVITEQRKKVDSAPAPAAATPEVSHAPEPTPQPAGRLPRRAAASRTTSRSVSRAPSPPPVDQTAVVTSTFPDETEAPRPPEPAPTAGPSTSGPKKPLRRRANREAPRIDLDDDWEMPSAENTQSSSLPQASHVPETQLGAGSSSQAAGTLIPDSMDVDTDATPAQPAASTSRSRLKRRAGAATQSSFLEGLDTSIRYEEDWKKKEAASEIQQLYERSKAETASIPPPPSKRPRTRRTEVEEPAQDAQSMDIDEDDYVAKALRSARTAKREKASPAKMAVARPESEAEEEVEEIVEQPRRRQPSPKKAATKPASKPTQHPDHAADVTKDEAFLQAIKTARGKKDIDELDKEFNQLRIPKPANGKQEVKRWEPDYKVLDDFDADMRGNFIEVVKKDLFRKDVPRKTLPVTSDGRPNFKKFKKKNIVRRQPVTLVLSAQNVQAAEMGEPYWTVEDANSQRKSQSQASGSRRGGASQSLDDDDAPLLPRSKGKRRLLSQIQEEDDDDEILSLPSATRRRGITPSTQEVASRARGRSTRAGSAASEASSRARRAPAKRVIEVLDDSDSDGAAFATARSSTRTRRGTAGQPSATLDFEDEPPRSTRATAGSGSTRTGTRRKLLVDDDDDDTTFKGVQKKRRLG